MLLLHPTASQRRQSATKVSAAFVESDDEDDEPSADGSTAISIEPGTGAAGSTPNVSHPQNCNLAASAQFKQARLLVFRVEIPCGCLPIDFFGFFVDSVARRRRWRRPTAARIWCI